MIQVLLKIKDPNFDDVLRRRKVNQIGEPLKLRNCCHFRGSFVVPGTATDALPKLRSLRPWQTRHRHHNCDERRKWIIRFAYAGMHQTKKDWQHDVTTWNLRWCPSHVWSKSITASDLNLWRLRWLKSIEKWPVNHFWLQVLEAQTASTYPFWRPPL